MDFEFSMEEEERKRRVNRRGAEVAEEDAELGLRVLERK